MFSNLFIRCPETGKITGVNRKAWPKWTLFITSFIAVVWYLIRVIPKPSRAAYPCMQATTPFRVTFLIWTASIFSTVFSFRKAKSLFCKNRYVYSSLFLLLTGFSVLVFVSSSARDAAGAFIGISPAGPNIPVGTARGIFPGRVAWVHNPDAGNWNGAGNWWDDSVNNQQEYDKMIPDAVVSLSGGSSEADAWDKIFHWFNNFKGQGDHGYQSGEKIAIKINQNNIQSHSDNNNSNGNPHLILALLKSLINGAGVPQDMITVSDPSRAISNCIYDKCSAVFPDVIYEDNLGGNGRVKASYISNVIPYSVDNGALAQGIASSFVEASYVINMAILKGHVGPGITFGAKNFYGALDISINWQENHHNNFDFSSTGSAKYMTFTDFMGHKDLGEKTILWIMDAVYPNQNLDGTPSGGWSMSPFNGDRPSSIFASLDGVANESVSLDFFRSNWPDAGKLEYCDQYMHEAALADDPDSETFYDPEQDGTGCTSLGVHEHWNNAVDKQYSRNLGTGEGIELDYVLAGSSVQVQKNKYRTARSFLSINGVRQGKVYFTLPEPGKYSMSFFNMQGRKAGEIINRIGSGGINTASIENMNIANGSYTVRLTSNGKSSVKIIKLFK